MTSIRYLPLTLAALVASTTTALGQGADLCASAQLISGTGIFNFDTTAATTDGAPDILCNYFGLQQINNDVWFSWVAPTTGSYTISTCAQTTMDSKIGIYDGSCAGAVIACQDDACSSLQTTLDFLVTQGNTYVIRLGNYPGTTTPAGTGTFTVSQTGILAVLDTRVNPANGHTYHLLASGTWGSAENTAISLGGHLATIDDAAENAWLVTQWQNYLGTPRDLWIGFNDVAVEGTFGWVDGSTSTYVNWDAGEPNNGLTGEDFTLIRRDSPTGNWNDLGAPAGFFSTVYGVVEVNSNPGVTFCAGDGSSTACPCGNTSAVGAELGCLNSLGGGGSLRAMGTASIAADTVLLQGGNVPNGPGLYFQGTLQVNGGLGVVFGDGLRCAGGTIIRLGIVAAAGNASTYPSGATPPNNIPVSLKGLVAAGNTRNYQLWYRDSAAGFCSAAVFNLTNGLQLAWAP